MVRTITANPINNAIFHHGNAIKPLDFFQATTINHAPQGHQTENHIIDENVSFTVNGHCAANDLDDYVDTPATLWGTGTSSNYGVNDKIIIGQSVVNNSLYLIKPDDTVIVQMQNEYGTDKLRIRFTYNSNEYLLTTTDMGIQNYFRDENNRLNDGEEEELDGVSYLTISLAEPLNGNLYKVVAGVF
ncbi:TPA: dual OB domain-containing protein [Klebsiella pneumoniae]